MLRNAVKMLTKNLGLKLLALTFAVTMWMAVVNLDDPSASKTFTIAVTFENEDAVTSQNKYYETEGESANATFTVRGKRSIVDELSASDFKATADMSQLVQQEDENFVPVEIVALRHSSRLTISKRTKELKVILGELMREAFMIQPNAQGHPVEGYTVGGMTVEPNRLWVTGPKEVVSLIDAVKAPIDVSNMSTDVSDNVVPVLLDKNGDVVERTRLKLSVDIVTVKADIVSEKTVPIKVNYNGKPAEGYEVISAIANPSNVTIKGESEILNAISAINIPESDISVEGAKEMFEQKLDINQYLPDGVSLSNSVEATVTVKIDVEQLERRVFHIPVRNIGVNDLPEGYRIEYNESNVDIEIYGLPDDLNELSANTLRPILDVGGLTAGRHVGQLKVTLDNRYIVGEAAISFTIYSDNSGADDNNQNGEGTGGDDDTVPDDNTGADNDTASDEGSGANRDTEIDERTGQEEEE